jgi:DNA repair protein RecO (recombination protein O)
MNWSDEGYLLSKNYYNENSIIIEAFTIKHGKYSGIVYGGSSRKQKRNIQVGNKIFLNWHSKGENRPGYFSVELIDPISPFFFDDKKKTTTILSATSILKILLPERQTNKKIYTSFDKMISNLKLNNWINFYLFWEISLIKELGFELDFKNENLISKNKNSIEINNKSFNIPKILLNDTLTAISNVEIKEALVFNKNLLIENFILPNNLRFPIFRNILESYYS